MPSPGTTSRRRRPLTYGKHYHDIHRDPSDNFESFRPSTLLNKSSKLSRTPPSVSTARSASNKARGDFECFDVPSSEEEHSPKEDLASRRRPPRVAAAIGHASEPALAHIPSSFPKRLPTQHIRKRKFDDALNQDVTASSVRRSRAGFGQYGSAQDSPSRGGRKSGRSMNKQKQLAHSSREGLASNKETHDCSEVSNVEQIPVASDDISQSAGNFAQYSQSDSNAASENVWDVPDSDSEPGTSHARKRPGSGTPKGKRKRQQAGSSMGIPHPAAEETTIKASVSAEDQVAESLTNEAQTSDQSASFHDARSFSTPERPSSGAASCGSYSHFGTPLMHPITDGPSVVHRRGVTTPKQARLWRELLNEDAAANTPSKSFGRLHLDQAALSKALGKAIHQKSPRKKLIDALMPSVPVSPEKMVDVHETLLGGEQDDNDSPHSNTFGNDAPVTGNLADLSDELKIRTMEPLPQSRAMSRGPKFTYSGQRSRLEDSNDTLDNLLAQPLDITISPIRQISPHDDPNSKLPLKRQRPGRTAASNPDDDDDGTKAVRTIHDLRAGGNSERFADEIMEILDDLSSAKSTVGRKRAALLELCRKLKAPTFRIRFIQGGNEFQVFQLCSTESDSILGAAAAAAVLFILGPEGNSCNPLHLLDAGVLTILGRMLDSKRDLISIAADRKSNMSRAAQGSVASLCRQVVDNTLWKEKNLQSVSPLSLALTALDLTVRKLRESGNGENLLEPVILGKLLDIFESALHSASACDAADVGLAALLDQLEAVTSILESCTTVAACALDSSLWSERLLERLVICLDGTLSISIPRGRAIWRLIPRLSLNLANNNPRSSRKFAEGGFINRLVERIIVEFMLLPDAAGVESMDLDVLLLCLGAMLNLAEWSDEVRQTVLRDGSKLLDSLVSIFQRGRKQTAEANSLAASQANVAYGWLAVLLGNLCQNAMIRTHVRNKLSGGGLNDIIEAVDEFIIHHKEADKTAQSNEAYVLFTERLQSIAEILRAL